MSSVYRQYFEAIEGVTNKVKCTIDVKDKKCGTTFNPKKASNLQDHLKIVHKDFYATIQASLKQIRQPNQQTLDSFGVVTLNKPTGAMRDLLMGFSISTMPINLLNNPSFKVSIF